MIAHVFILTYLIGVTSGVGLSLLIAKGAQRNLRKEETEWLN
jgi:hypothetical protein